MKDRNILKSLLEKYGKDELINAVNEAFKSSKLLNYTDAVKKHNKAVIDKAAADRKERVEKLNRKYFDPSNYEGDDAYTKRYFYDYDPEDEVSKRRRYDWSIESIKRDFNSFIDNGKLEELNKYFNRYGFNSVDWSQVTDEDFVEIDKSQARKYARDTRWSEFILFWEDEAGKVFAVSRGTTVLYTIESLRVKGRWGVDNTKIKDLIESPKTVKVFALNVQKHDATRNEKEIQRKLNRHGRMLRTEDENKEIRNQNIKRYKRIIAQNNIEKFDVIDKTVRKTVKDCATYYLEDDSDLNTVKKIGSEVDKLLVFYANFCDNRNKVKSADTKSDTSRWASASEYNRNVKKFANYINDQVNKIYEMLP